MTAEHGNQPIGELHGQTKCFVNTYPILQIAADPSNVNHVMGGTQDNGTQRTLGTINWVAAFGGDGGKFAFTQPTQFILGETQITVYAAHKTAVPAGRRH
jgi:hypothetical protein